MMDIPFLVPDLCPADGQAVAQAVTSGWITTGPRTKQFEQQLAAYTGSRRAVCLNSATACMEMTLRVLGIGPGDEVITTAYTYTATASVICHVGATPVLVDTAPGSYEMDYDAMERRITERTKAIIAVDLAGVLCDYDRIFAAVERRKALFRPSNALQEQYGRVIVMADAAHALGAYRINPDGSRLMCGQIADFTSFSFHAVKNLTTAEGGAVVWRSYPGIDDDALYKQYMLLSLHGQSKDALEKTKNSSWEYDILSPAYKCNMTDIAAALGMSQLARYGQIMEKRHAHIALYDRLLADVPVLRTPHRTPAMVSSAHLYLVRLEGKTETERNAVIERLRDQGVCTNVHYKPLPMLTAYKNLGFSIADFPNAFAMYQNEVTLPLYPSLTEEQVTYVAECLKDNL